MIEFQLDQIQRKWVAKRNASQTPVESVNASINSSCYHPPRDFFFFCGTTNSPRPGRQKLRIPRPRATEKQQQKY